MEKPKIKEKAKDFALDCALFPTKIAIFSTMFILIETIKISNKIYSLLKGEKDERYYYDYKKKEIRKM